MKVESTHVFIKIFKKRFIHRPNIRKRFDERVKQFVKNPNNPNLADHSLGGKLKGHRAFSITGDVRVVYYVHNHIAYFVDIGTHTQVYKK